MSDDTTSTATLEPTTAGSAAVVPGTSAVPASGNADAMSAAKESLEDYTLRFAPRSYRKWSAGVVASR